jgi:hypothetical protein
MVHSAILTVYLRSLHCHDSLLEVGVSRLRIAFEALTSDLLSDIEWKEGSMKIERADQPTVGELSKLVRTQISGCSHLETAAQDLVAKLYDRFGESIVIARVFLTVPFHVLPDASRKFVEQLAGSAELKPATPVLTLIGTRGKEADWNDRRKSRGHVGIPLLSSAFVDGIPMISRLLSELGVPLEWADQHDPSVVIEKLGGAAGLFYVENAAEAVDRQGRKIIAAQDFVSQYGVQTVFGIGTVYDTGQMLVVVVFCRDLVSREAAELFPPLIETFKDLSGSLTAQRAIFSDAA